MRKFADSYADENYAAAAAQMPWGHNMLLLDKIPNDIAQRIWYIQQAIENGWSRGMLEMWIESNLYGRKGKAITNFKQALSSPMSDIAEQTIKDPYNFGFLALDKKYREKELEQGLMDHFQKFLLELGSHVANGGYMVHPHYQGKGVGNLMVSHSLEEAKRKGFKAMQFNLVVSTNIRAVNLYQKLGFKIVGQLPKAFNHLQLGYVDAYVMHRFLE